MNNKKLIKRIYNVVIVLLLIGAITYVVTRFAHPANTEYTDDAQVQRHITPINTRVQGFIKEIRFEEYQHVKKGDTLVIIEEPNIVFSLLRQRPAIAAHVRALLPYQPE